MIDVLLGRDVPPVDPRRVESLAEVASAYYARGKEIEMLILQGEREGRITKTSGLYRFRTGELRAFIDLAKMSYDIGSRRITTAKMEV